MRKMTTSFVVAIGLVAFAGCSKKKEEGTAQKPTEGPAVTPPPKPEPPKPMTGPEMADKYKACLGKINEGKLDEFRKDCIADNYVGHDTIGMGMETKGGDAVLEYFKSQRAAFSDWKLEPQIVVVSGRNIFGVLLATGTHTGPMEGVQPTNKKIGLLMFHRLLIDEQNKAVEEWPYMDPSTMMGQLGLAPKDAPPTRPAMDKGIEGAPIVLVTADDDKEKANIELIKKQVQLVNDKKYADAWAMLAPDAMLSDNTAPADVKGAKEIEKNAKVWLDAFPDFKVDAQNTWAAGDYVIVTGKVTGTHQKDLGKLKKTGKSINLDFAEVNQIKDGKIAQVWRFHSGMQFASQLGLMPPPGAEAPPAGGAKEPAKEPAKERAKKM